MHDILIHAGIGRVYWIIYFESKRANARSTRVAASGHEPPLIIVSPYWQLSDAKRHFGKDFAAIEV